MTGCSKWPCLLRQLLHISIPDQLIGPIALLMDTAILGLTMWLCLVLWISPPCIPGLLNPLISVSIALTTWQLVVTVLSVSSQLHPPLGRDALIGTPYILQPLYRTKHQSSHCIRVYSLPRGTGILMLLQTILLSKPRQLCINLLSHAVCGGANRTFRRLLGLLLTERSKLSNL